LCLIKMNVLIALIIAALTGGVLSGMSIVDTINTLIGGMSGNAETALSYILLGALAAAIGKTGVADLLAKGIADTIKDKRTTFIFIIAGVACFSQNLIPVHIAFIPILIPPLISVMNRLKIDRRAVATALTFGLKAPYVMVPAGFGLIFHNTIRDAMIDNGMAVETSMIWKSMFIPGVGMIVGLLIAVLITYRKPREYEDIQLDVEKDEFAQDAGGSTTTKTRMSGMQMFSLIISIIGFIVQVRIKALLPSTAAGIVAIIAMVYALKHMPKEQIGALIGAIIAFVIQIKTDSLPLGAIGGLAIMMIFGSFKWSEMDEMMDNGIGIMGFIAFVMLVASGYGEVIRETGGVDALVESSAAIMGGSKAIAAFIMLLIGLIITMGIGTSFGTIPIIATIFVPLATELGFDTAAIIALIGTAGALGDAGSPASDSTLGPTSGLNVDGQHDHIWDTVVPTFIHYNIPLIIFGTIAAIVL